MKIAVIGSGAREHAISWKLSQSPRVEKVFVLPGNGGTQNNVDIAVNDFEGIKQFCINEGVDLIFVGPEDPLARGIVDYFKESSIRVFGPDRQAARLEGSKIWAKQFMKRHGVATADFWLPKDADEIRQIAQELDGHLVVKYDGLAAGKGVFVCSSTQEVYTAIDEIERRYGPDAAFILERKISGRELSVIGFTDGKDIRLLLPSQDHKPAYDGDQGPNTGGMGAFCPVPWCDEALMNRIDRTIVQPTLQGIQKEGLDYHGVLYFGLMITDQGAQLLEYNVRFGDPETEVILPALQSDLLELTLSCLDGTLKEQRLEFESDYFVDVVLASGGYPAAYEKGKEIKGLQEVDEEILVFHAGTVRDAQDRLLTAGGRVLNVVARGADLHSAIERAYKAVGKISFDQMFFRRDIARKGIAL